MECVATHEAASCPIRAPRGRHRTEGGVTLLEATIGMLLLAVALLTHASSTISEHRLAREERVRSEGLVALEQFVERLRSDEDWSGLYARLRVLADAAATPTPGSPTFDNGSAAYAPNAYFADYNLAGDLSTVWFLVEVPADPLDDDPEGPSFLREDVEEPAFGLPADLNGDGTIASTARDGDYAALPVLVRMRWIPPGEGAREMRLGIWLRGDR